MRLRRALIAFVTTIVIVAGSALWATHFARGGGRTGAVQQVEVGNNRSATAPSAHGRSIPSATAASSSSTAQRAARSAVRTDEDATTPLPHDDPAPPPIPTTTPPTAAPSTAPAPAPSSAPGPAPLAATAAAVLPTPVPPPPNPYAPGPVTQIATLRIPKVGLVSPLYEGVTLTVINRGPGHWPGTATPGTFGNVVVGGHRTTYTHPFLDIDRLQPGDQIIFDLPNGTEAIYATTRTEVVTPKSLWIVNQTPGYAVTLFACHPKGSAADRIVVHGTLVSLRKV
jgi:sortase A